MLFDLARLITPTRFTAVGNDELRRMVGTIPTEGVDRRRCLFDLLDEAHKFVVPKWMIDRELSVIWEHLKADHKSGKFDPEDVGKTEVQLKAEYRTIAERRVRLAFVLDEIAKRNDIRVDREDVGFARANGYRGPKSAILEEKVVEFIFALA